MSSLDTEISPGSRRKTAFINLFFHYVSIFITLAHGILLAPLYLRHVGAELYGAWLATGNIVAWIELVDPGLSTVLQQRVASVFGSRKLDELRSVIGNGLLLSLFLSLLPLLAWPIAGFLPGLFHLSADSSILTEAFKIALVSSATAFASFAVTAVNIGLQRPTATGLIYVVAALTGLASTILLLKSGIGLCSLPLGMLIRNVILLSGNFVVFLAWRRCHLEGSFSITPRETAEFARLLSFSFVGRLGGTLFERMESFLTATLIAPQFAAVLSLTGRPFDPLRLATTRISAAIAPSLAHLSGEGELAKLAAWVKPANMAVTTLTLVGTATIVGFNHDLVSLWVGPEMFAGNQVTLMLAMACALQIMTGHLTQVLFALGRIEDVSRFNLLEGVLKVPILFVCLKTFGLIGAPLATIIATLLVGGWKLPFLYADSLETDRKSALMFWLKQHCFNLAVSCLLLASLSFLRAQGMLLASWLSLAAAAFATASVVLIAFASFTPELRLMIQRLAIPGRLRNSSTGNG